MRKCIKIISFMVAIVVLVLCTSCSKTKTEASSKTSSVSENTSSQILGPPPEVVKKNKATHLVIAVCSRVEIEDETITYTFEPIVVYMGDFGEKQHTQMTDHYYVEAFCVQGNVKNYSLDDVYARGNSYLLWLNEKQTINGRAYYNDLKPYGTEIMRVQEDQDYYSFEGIEQVLEHLYSPSGANNELLRFVEDFMAEKQKETSSKFSN